VNVIEKQGRPERLIYKGEPSLIRGLLEEKYNTVFEKTDFEKVDNRNYEVAMDKKRRSFL
jgi:hypothetical protein